VARTPKAAGAFTSVALIFLCGLVGGAVVNLFYPVPIWPGTWIRLVGLVPLAVGIWLLASARAAFKRHRTALMPWTPSAELVQDGPYRFTRNPVYLAFALMYLGAGFIFNSTYVLVMLAIIIVLFDFTQIPREERYLQEMFGEEFIRYEAKVRRWI
jgi:protein-S-isoprenylcysteine O-methyltransferase Ste14